MRIRNVIRFVSPLLYGAGCVFVFALGVFVATSPAVVRLSEALPGRSYVFGNLAIALVLLLLVCTPLFAVFDLTLYRLEELQSLGLRDHARHCAMVYAGIAFVFVLLVVSDLETGMLQYDMGLALCAIAAYGVLVDAGVMLSMRRLARAQPGGAP
jgi:hypothetical protein